MIYNFDDTLAAIVQLSREQRGACAVADCENNVDRKDLQCQLCPGKPALCSYHLELHIEDHQAERECAAEAEACSR